MALVVEDGTGKADAESYCSVASATAYHAARGNDDWAALTDTLREQCLRRATDALVQMFRGRWAGTRVNTTQALDWPRSNVPITDGPGAGRWTNYYPFDTVPAAVANACAELALRAITADLIADGSQALIREKIGPLEIEYQPGSNDGANYRAIESMLAPFLSANSGQIHLVRG